MLLKKYSVASLFAMGIALITLTTSCQKFDRPELVLIPDPPVVNTPLKMYLPFEGSLKDSGQNNSTVTSSGTISYVSAAGVSGQALQGSSSGYLLINNPGDSIMNLGSATVSFWVNSSSVANATGLMCISDKTQFWGSWEIFFEGYTTDNTSAFLKTHMFNTNVPAASAEKWTTIVIPNVFNKWSHIAVTYDAATETQVIYANGVAVKTDVFTGYGKLKFGNMGAMAIGTFGFQTNPSLTTGASSQSWARNLAGQMDQFRIYNKALTAAEINSLYTTKK
jgi:hypothetical protein